MRVDNKPVRDTIENLIDAGIAATCPTVDLEVGYSSRSPSDLRAARRLRGEYYVNLPLDDRAARRALNVQQFLADKGLHRAAGAMDLLTAAVAELNRAVILHYDADFEYIASVTGQQQQWIVPRGSVD